MKCLAYFDCAATTPVDPEVFLTMQPFFSEDFGNPGSLHALGQKAQAAVDLSRKTIADYLGVDFPNVIFMASASEANSLAVKGVVAKARTSGFEKPHLIVSKIEHRSILNLAEDLARLGEISFDYVGVDANGIVNVESLKRLLCKETVLVSVMQVNNETGVIQPIKKLARIIKEFRQEKILVKNQSRFSVSELQYPLFHTDSVQALMHLEEIKPNELGVDLMSLSSHKVYGPKGTAALVSGNLSFSKLISPYIVGGSQEFSFRSGTENVPSIVGFAKAVEVGKELHLSSQKMTENIKAQMVKKILKVFPKVVFNSPETSIPEILNASFPGYQSEDLIYAFDKEGVAVSAGSACEARALQISHVLLATGLSKELANSVIRFSFGRLTKKKELDYLFGALEKIFSKH